MSLALLWNSAAVAALVVQQPVVSARRSPAVMSADRTFAPSEAKGGTSVDTKKTAVVFIEYQNEFTTEGGKLHGAVKECMDETGMLKKSSALASKARAAGAKVFHAPISFKEDASDKLFTEGSWNADFHPSMQPQPGDVVVQNKKGLDAFPGTDLEAQLKANGIETVVLAGFLTNCCVESTMRTAYEKGFNVITLTDACATTSKEGQAVTGGSYGMFSTPMTVADYEKML